MIPSSSVQEEEKQPHREACVLGWLPHTIHLPPPSPEEESGLSFVFPASELGWGESWNPEEVQQFQDAITQERQTSLESLIFKSENLENLTTWPFLAGHHPLRRKGSCLLTQTQNSLSHWLTYPFWSGSPLCQLSTLSENKGRERRIMDICWLLHPST